MLLTFYQKTAGISSGFFMILLENDLFCRSGRSGWSAWVTRFLLGGLSLLQAGDANDSDSGRLIILIHDIQRYAGIIALISGGGDIDNRLLIALAERHRQLISLELIPLINADKDD